MTNKGLRIELPLLSLNGQVHFAFLNCQRSSKDDNIQGIYLNLHSSGKNETFSRIFADLAESVERENVSKLEQQTIYVTRKNVEDRNPIEAGDDVRVILEISAWVDQ